MECKSEPGVSQGSPPHTQTQTRNPVMMLFFAGAVFPLQSTLLPEMSLDIIAAC